MSENTGLTTTERVRLEQYEKIIERGKQTFIEVGSALMSIRDSRLYRATHATFEDYCRERWGWNRDYANKLIRAAGVVANLDTAVSKPTAEKQVRPLAKLEPEEQAEAWKEAVETAPGGKVTERHVREVVEKMTAEAIVDDGDEEYDEPELEQSDGGTRPDTAFEVFKEYVDATLRHVSGIEAKHMVINEMIKYLRSLSVEFNRKAGVA